MDFLINFSKRIDCDLFLQAYNNIKANHRLTFLKGSLFLGAGIGCGTLLAANIVVITSYLGIFCVINALALTALGLKTLNDTLKPTPPKLYEIPSDDCHINDLPDEILVEIFSYLLPRTQLSLVCWRWENINGSDLLWKDESKKLGFVCQLFKKDFFAIGKEAFLINILKERSWALANLNFNSKVSELHVSPETNLIAFLSRGFKIFHPPDFTSTWGEDELACYEVESLHFSQDGQKVLHFGTFQGYLYDKGVEIFDKEGKELSRKKLYNLKPWASSFQIFSPSLNKCFVWTKGDILWLKYNTEKFVVHDFLHDKEIELPIRDNLTKKWSLELATFSSDDIKLICTFRNLTTNKNLIQVWDLKLLQEWSDAYSEHFTSEPKLKKEIFTQEAVIAEFRPNYAPTAISFSKNGRFFAIAYINSITGKAEFEIYDIERRESKLYDYAEDCDGIPITSMEFLSEDRILVTATSVMDENDETSKKYRIWNVETGRNIHTLTGNFSAGGRVRIGPEEKGQRQLVSFVPRKSHAPGNFFTRMISGFNDQEVQWL